MENATNVKKIFLVFGISLLLINIVYADCNWNLEILSENIFENEEDFEFKYKIIKIDGNKTNVTLIRKIEDTYGNTVKSYSNYTKEITTQHTTPYLSPNLNPNTYLIKGEIFPDCNDTDLSNNLAEKLIIILQPILQQDLTEIKINEFLPDPEGYDNSIMPQGEWIELYNEGGSTIDLNGFYFQDISNKKLYISSTTTYNTTIQPYSFLVVYANGFSGLLNNDGYEKIMFFSNNSILIDEVSYSGSQEGVSWSKTENYWIKAPKSPGSQNIINFSSKSKVEIEKVYLGSDKKAKFGDLIRVKVFLYKANTTKNIVELYLEDDLSKRTKTDIKNVFSNQTLTLPLQIVSNCNNKLKHGKYKLILTGLGDKDEEEIEIQGNNDEFCDIIIKEKIVKEDATSKEQEKTETFINENKKAIPETIYSASNIKANRSALYFFTVILTLLLIELIRKK
jgi:hypothetical protein